jgi:adenine-specific DNA-methyltransferase
MSESVQDCRIETDDNLSFLSTVPDGGAELVITSPPYNLGKEYEEPMPLGEWAEGQEAVILECARTLCPGGSLCWEVGTYVDSDAKGLPAVVPWTSSSTRSS